MRPSKCYLLIIIFTLYLKDGYEIRRQSHKRVFYDGGIRQALLLTEFCFAFTGSMHCVSNTYH